MDCSICLEQATGQTGQATLSCGHTFHVGCIAGWLVADGPKSCPNCRNPLGPYERLAPDSPVSTGTLTYEPEDDPPVLQLGVETEETIRFQYTPPIAPYIWNQVSKTGVDHLAAYSRVYTSLLTIQAVMRGHLIRRAIRSS